LSLSVKYSLAGSKNLGGIGIWALSYEGGSNEIWRTINKAFYTSDSEINIPINIYPNPVYSLSKIEFYIAEKEHITLKILDLTGRERVVLVDEERDSGYYSEDFNSAGYGQGLYLCVLQTNKISYTRTLIIIH
jgi:hypothetical protein